MQNTTEKEIHLYMSNEKENNFKHKQQDLTELNADGNRDRGRYGEDVSPPSAVDDAADVMSGVNNTLLPNELTEEEKEELEFKKRLEALRKRDPFIYR